MAMIKKPANHPENFNAWMEEICSQLMKIKGVEWFGDNIKSLKDLASSTENIPKELINVEGNKLVAKNAKLDYGNGTNCINLGEQCSTLGSNSSVFGTSNVSGGMFIKYDDTSVVIVDLDENKKYTQLQFKKSLIRKSLQELAKIAKPGTVCCMIEPLGFSKKYNTFESYDTSTGILTLGSRQSESSILKGIFFYVDSGAEDIDVCGTDNINAGASSHVEGTDNINIGKWSHVEGKTNLCFSPYSHVEGQECELGGQTSHVEGFRCRAFGSYSHAQNHLTSASGCQTAMGSSNIPSTSGGVNAHNPDDLLLLVGNGVDVESNAFTVDWSGNCNAGGSYNTIGKDYSEIFEWVDGNPNSEDRVGYFVTLDGPKIKIMENDDDYVVGVVSSTPSIIGDSYVDRWRNKYETDEWERIIYEKVETTDENSELKYVMVPKINSKFTRELNDRFESQLSRKEKSAIGMLGKLLVRDDGSCVVNGYCKPIKGGIGTQSDTGYRVLERINDNVVRILFTTLPR